VANVKTDKTMDSKFTEEFINGRVSSKILKIRTHEKFY